MRKVIAIAGRMGSGKSVIADGVAESLGGGRRSFGEVVRRVATDRDLPGDRASLQRLGDQLIQVGWPAFCRLVVADLPDGITVIDGIRHFGAIDALRSESGDLAIPVIFIDAPTEVRFQRVELRDGASREQFDAAETSSNEAEVEMVRRVSDLVVDNGIDRDEGLDQVINAIVAWYCNR